nr:zinc finger, CCHC-type [Tanacetum cinerariifolium]
MQAGLVTLKKIRLPVAGIPSCWRCNFLGIQKQTCITGSTIEYEFVALADTTKEAEWLNNLLFEFPLWSKPIAHTCIRCDSTATLAKAYSQMYNRKSRHLGVRHSMILSKAFKCLKTCVYFIFRSNPSEEVSSVGCFSIEPSAATNATNSDSIVEPVMHVCFLEAYEMTQTCKVQEVHSLGDKDYSRIVSDKRNDQVETGDCNVIPDSPDMCDNDIQNDQNVVECDDERVVLANLIENLKLDVYENKKIQKQLKKANTTLAQELKECKSILAETSRTLGESTSIQDSCLVALQSKQTEFEKYKACNDCTVDYDKLKRKLNETLGLLAQKDIDIKEGLKLKAYEISVVKEKHDEKSPKHVSVQTPRESVGSNEMVHNYYLKEAKKKAQLQKDKSLNTKPSVQQSARLPNIANGLDDGVAASFQLESDSSPHAHAQTTKTY